MRVSCKTGCTLLLANLVLSNTCVSAFVPSGLGRIKANCSVLRKPTSTYHRKSHVDYLGLSSGDEIGQRERGYALWKRLDTLESAGLTQSVVGPEQSSTLPTRRDAFPPLLSSATTLGFVGHTGLLLVSTLIINITKAIFFTKPPTEEEELLASTGDAPPKQSGMMDRCPWPFIFFHDPKQGMKDSPTWVMVCWYCLYRIWKYRSAAGVV